MIAQSRWVFFLTFFLLQIFILPTRALPHVANMKRQMLSKLIFHQIFSSDSRKNKESKRKTRKHVSCIIFFLLFFVKSSGKLKFFMTFCVTYDEIWNMLLCFLLLFLLLPVKRARTWHNSIQDLTWSHRSSSRLQFFFFWLVKNYFSFNFFKDN